MEQENKIKNVNVETYAGDIAHVIEDGTEGLVKKIIHEEEESQIEKNNTSPESKKNKFFVFVGISLIVLSATTLIYFFFFKEKINIIPVEKQFIPIIFNDKTTFDEIFGLNKDKIIQTVANQVNATEVKKGGVEGIYLTENKKIIGLRRFVDLIKANFVPNDNKLFVSDNFLLGVVNGEAKDFFVLLKARSTFDIFDSLRIWEDKIFSDLNGFLGVNINNDTKYLLTKNFEDGIIENKNARILYDKDGKIIMMYIFADDNSVIITDSQSAAHEILLRLAASEKKQ